MGQLFDKILIANRGEIACRIIRSCRDLGIKTVAVYSDADADAEHVRRADEAVAIGPAASSESYLVIEKIIAACKESGAGAVHPGFGFLSENAAFVEALEAAGIAFIGPPLGAIAAMGDKITSKKLAEEAKVSTVPGHMGLIADADEAVRISASIGYPVMIKASAGGGGKGMRVAGNDEEAREGFTSARNEARTSFGDERIFIEKYIEEPRHIEIQVLADKHGKVLHLGERECSIQRRHQKVIEEAPSPALDAVTRKAMGEQAVTLARAVDYCSAGTVEFIFDKHNNFYFLEMNTRIQVEHPVTEMVTGIDLVAWMIRIAAGEALDFAQQDLRMDGWAIESRIYAEDPFRNFMPSTGRLVSYREPKASELGDGVTVRVDSGVVEGSEISMHYDPMIAKLVTHAADRAGAVAAMQQALDRFYIRGIRHNISFLAAVMAEERFQDGRLSTDFIADTYPKGFHGRVLPTALKRELLAIGAALHHRLAKRNYESIGGPLASDAAFLGDWDVICEREHWAFDVREAEGCFLISNGQADDIELLLDGPVGARLVSCSLNGETRILQVERCGPGWVLTHAGTTFEILVLRPQAGELATLMPVKEPPDLSGFLLSPMPGLLVSISVAVGEEVKAGQQLAVVEAMKMENILRSEKDGTVLTLHAEPGSSLAVDQAILEFE
jgi:propionyl-CoA carboxylase alpha chain